MREIQNVDWRLPIGIGMGIAIVITVCKLDASSLKKIILKQKQIC